MEFVLLLCFNWIHFRIDKVQLKTVPWIIKIFLLTWHFTNDKFSVPQFKLISNKHEGFLQYQVQIKYFNNENEDQLFI
jgi:hypothetical protein